MSNECGNMNCCWPLTARSHHSNHTIELHWLPMAAKIDYRLCLIVHKSLLGQRRHNTSAISLCGATRAYNLYTVVPVADIPARSNLRASTDGDLFAPRTKRTIDTKAFSVSAPRVWDTWSIDLKLKPCSLPTQLWTEHVKCNRSTGWLKLNDTTLHFCL